MNRNSRISEYKRQTRAAFSRVDPAMYCPIPHFIVREFSDKPEQARSAEAVRYAHAVHIAVDENREAFGFGKGFDAGDSANAISRIIDDEYNSFVCMIGEEVVGGVSWRRPSPTTLEVGFLFRHKRVAQAAIGRQLLRSVLNISQAIEDKPVDDIYLDVINPKARSIYESVGFVATREWLSDNGYVVAEMHLIGRDNIQHGIETLTQQILEANTVPENVLETAVS